MTNRLRHATFATLLILGTASAAGAQITTVIGGIKRNDAASQQQAARVEQAAQDSVARVTLTGMTQWVDSAAASLSLRPDTGSTPQSDTSAAAQRPVPPTRSDSAAAARPREASQEMRDGARAPNTATPLPTIALAGGVLIVIGVAMRRRPAAVRARTSR